MCRPTVGTSDPQKPGKWLKLVQAIPEIQNKEKCEIAEGELESDRPHGCDQVSLTFLRPRDKCSQPLSLPRECRPRTTHLFGSWPVTKFAVRTGVTVAIQLAAVVFEPQLVASGRIHCWAAHGLVADRRRLSTLYQARARGSCRMAPMQQDNWLCLMAARCHPSIQSFSAGHVSFPPTTTHLPISLVNFDDTPYYGRSGRDRS